MDPELFSFTKANGHIKNAIYIRCQVSEVFRLLFKRNFSNMDRLATWPHFDPKGNVSLCIFQDLAQKWFFFHWILYLLEALIPIPRRFLLIWRVAELLFGSGSWILLFLTGWSYKTIFYQMPCDLSLR